MNHKARRIIEQLACERRYGIADEKGAEYSGAGSTYKETGADTLHNFKSVAERTGCTPEQTLMTYLLKHIDSINTAVKEAAQCEAKRVTRTYQPDDPNPREVYAKGEGIVSRLDDARNYLDLLECLLVDLSCIGNPAEYAVQEPGPDDLAKLSAEHFFRGVEYTEPEDPAVHLEIHKALYGPDAIQGFDGVSRPRSAPEGTPIIPPLCWGGSDQENPCEWGETGELT
jgi:hypothetical protein